MIDFSKFYSWYPNNGPYWNILYYSDKSVLLRNGKFDSPGFVRERLYVFNNIYDQFGNVCHTFRK